MLPTITDSSELPLDTLELSELLLQWKVMKALGYKSLFDPGFRRELRNPLRRLMYYTIVVEEERQEKMFFVKALESASDKIGYYSDPDLYHKMKEAENRMKVSENLGDNEFVSELKNKAKAMEQAHIGLSNKDREEVLSILK